MSTYGFTIDIDGNASAVMKKIEDAIASMGGKIHNTTNKVKEDMGGLVDGIKKVGEALALAFVIDKVKEFGTEILHITAEFQGFENVIKYSSIDAKDAGDNLGYIKDAVDRLHLPVKEAYESFSEMQAGFYGTGIEGKALRDVFEGVAEGATTLHLSANSFSRVTFALKEIGELGTLQARQMRMLAFALPGAMNLAAKSMKMNAAEFHEAMSKNGIDSATFLRNFSKELKEHFQGGLENAGNSLISKMNDANNSIVQLKLKIGNDLEPLFVKILSSIASVMEGFKGMWNWINANAAGLREFATAVIAVVSGLLVYNAIIKITAAWTALMTWLNGASTAAIILNTLVTEGLSAAWVALGIAFEMNPLGWIITLIVALVVSIMVLWDKFEGFRKVVGAVFGFFRGEIMATIHLWKNFAQIVWDILTGQFKKAFEDGKKMITEFKNDVTKGMIDSIKDGAEAAGKSDFKFSNLLKFGTGQEGPSKDFPGGGGGGGGEHGGGHGVKDSAINTSALAGGKGGLGEAKVINIHIDTMQKVTVASGKDLKEKGQDAVEVMLRTLNNIAYSQSRQ